MKMSKCLGWMAAGLIAAGLGGCAITPHRHSEVTADPSFEASRATPIGLVVTDENGQVRRGGSTEIETRCLQALMAKRYELVERAKLSSLVLNELKFQESGLTESDAVRLGKLANARAMMLVQVTDLQSITSGNERSFITFTRERARLTMRVIDVETGKLMWLASAEGTNAAFGGSEPIELVKQMAADTIAKLPAPGEVAATPLATAGK